VSRAKKQRDATGAPGPEETEETAAAAVRMRLWVGRARAGGALLGFVLGMLVCRRAGIPLVDATLRSLLAGAALSLVSWWSTLLVLQALIRTAAVQRHEEVAAAMAEVAAAQADRRAQEDEEIKRRLRRHRGEPDPEPDVPSDSADAEAADGAEAPA
jgi:hypothetical protein